MIAEAMPSNNRGTVGEQEVQKAITEAGEFVLNNGNAQEQKTEAGSTEVQAGEETARYEDLLG